MRDFGSGDFPGVSGGGGFVDLSGVELTAPPPPAVGVGRGGDTTMCSTRLKLVAVEVAADGAATVEEVVAVAVAVAVAAVKSSGAERHGSVRSSGDCNANAGSKSNQISRSASKRFSNAAADTAPPPPLPPPPLPVDSKFVFPAADK